MNTQDLIRAVVADNKSASPPISRTLAAAVAAGAIAAVITFALTLGLRSDFGWSIVHSPRFQFKFLFTLAVALAAAQRSTALPDMPTFAELGVPNLDFSVWVGFLAPAGTPKAIVDKLNREIVAIVREPAMTARLLEIGFEVVASTPEEFGQTLKADQERYGVVVRKAGVKLD